MTLLREPTKQAHCILRCLKVLGGGDFVVINGNILEIALSGIEEGWARHGESQLMIVVIWMVMMVMGETCREEVTREICREDT